MSETIQSIKGTLPICPRCGCSGSCFEDKCSFNDGPAPAPPPAKESVVIELTVKMIVGAYCAKSDDDHKFFFEEHHCINNVIDTLSVKIDKDNEISVCNSCHHATVKYIGKLADLADKEALDCR